MSKRGLPVQVKMRHEPHFVEELTVRHGEEPVGRMLALERIEPDPDQPRSTMGDLAELAASIRAKGILEPILVRPLPGGRAGADEIAYRIISGERRYHAAREAGLYEVPAIVMEVDATEALELALVENLQRKDLTPFEEAEGYRTLGEVHGYTHQEIAAAVGKSRSLVTESLRLLAMSQRVRDAAQALEIQSRSILLEVLKAGRTDDERIGLLERVAGEGMNRDELRAAARQARPRRPGRPKKPTFTFRDPDNTFSLSVRFRRSEVEKKDLIAALERILGQLRQG